MKITLLEGTTYKGKKYKKGADLEVTQGIGLRLCAMSKAVDSKTVKAPVKPKKDEKKAE